jgi:hypothetical protein
LVTFIACEIVTSGRLTKILGVYPGWIHPAGDPAKRLRTGACCRAVSPDVADASFAAQLFDALDMRSNFEPIMQSVRDLNKLDDA